MKQRTIAITGAFGFIGCRLLSALSESFPSHQLRALDTKEPPVVLPDHIRVISGRVEDPRTAQETVSGADAVVHLAAIVEPHSNDVEAFRRVNVEGAQNVYRTAIASRCSLFIHMSSAGVYGPPSRPSPHREDDVPSPHRPYERSKWEAEQALHAVGRGGTTLNILRPAGVYGPGSVLEIPEYRRIVTKRWTIELPGDVIVHPTHVDDVVAAIRALIDDPAAHGTVFNIGGQRAIRLQELRALVGELLGVRRTRVVLPPWLAGPVAGLAGPLLAHLGTARPLLRDMSRGSLFSAAVDDARFRDRYRDVPVVALEHGLSEHLAWARASGLL